MKKTLLVAAAFMLLSACGPALPGASPASKAPTAGATGPEGETLHGQQEATSTPSTDSSDPDAFKKALDKAMAEIPDTTGLSQPDVTFVTMHSNAGHFTAQQLLDQGRAVCDALHSGKTGDQLRDDTMRRYSTPFVIATLDVTSSVGRFCRPDLMGVLFYDKLMVAGPMAGKIVRDPAHNGSKN